MQNSFYKDEQELFKNYLSLSTFKEEYNFNHMSVDSEATSIEEAPLHAIELIIRPECTQKCEYCYVARYGEDLFPVEERASREEILHNIDLILDYVFNTKNLYINHWEFFAGDLFYDDLYFDVIDIFTKYLREKQKRYPNVFLKFPGVILTPNNFSFIRNKERKARLEEYMANFEQEFNWELGFSISTDGKYATDTREHLTLPDEYFDELFQWTLKYKKNGFHPMIAKSNLNTAIENYEWWKKMCAKWYTDVPEKRNDYLPYWLHARNDEWEPEDIDKMLVLINYMFEDRFLMHKNDIDALTYHLFIGDGANNTLPSVDINDLIRLKFSNLDDSQRINCSMSGSTCIQVNNLSFAPCHRTTYAMFKGGHFVVENDKIVDIAPNNVTMYLNLKLNPIKDGPRCANCLYNIFCIKGCYGAQYESSGEVFLPGQKVCKLEQTMIEFLIWKYNKVGIFASAERQGFLDDSVAIPVQAILEDMKERRVNYEYIENRTPKCVDAINE